MSHFMMRTFGKKPHRLLRPSRFETHIQVFTPRPDKSQMVMNHPSPQDRALRKETQSTKSSNEIFIALQNILPWPPFFLGYLF